MADKLDFKKLYKDLYQPGKAPALIEVPPICYLMVDGQGAPEGEEYQQALGLLYSVTFTIKMSRMKGPALPGYVDFVLPALEGLWDQVPTGQMEERDTWRWTSMIRMPDYVTQGIFEWAVSQAKEKKPDLDYCRIRLERYEESLCVQLMHIGPYAEEATSIERMATFIREHGLVDDCGKARRHHEIYLSDPRRTAPGKLKTVLRHPVRRG